MFPLGVTAFSHHASDCTVCDQKDTIMYAAGCVFVTAKVASKIVVNSCDVDIDTSATFDSLLTNVLKIENVEISRTWRIATLSCP